jgi:hypothetical protein
MRNLYALLVLKACVLLSAKEVVMVDSMVAGSFKFAVPDGASVRAERAADDGTWFANQVFVYDAGAGYLVSTLQVRPWSASKALEIGDPSVRGYFRPAGSIGGRVVGEVKAENFGAARALLQVAESNPASGVPAVPHRSFRGKASEDGVPEFKDARFSARCLLGLGDAVFLFQVNGKDAEQVGQLLKQVCASAVHVNSGISAVAKAEDAPCSIMLEHVAVTFTPAGPFKINGALPGEGARRYSGNVVVNSLDGSYTIAMGEGVLNGVDTGSDDEMRIRLCRGIFAATGGDASHAEGKVLRAAGKTVTLVRQTSSSRDKWDAQCVILEDGKKVGVFVTARNQATLDKVLKGLLPQ